MGLDLTPAGDWPSNGGTSEGSLSGTNQLGPGTYRYKTAAQCRRDTICSTFVTIRVIRGAQPTIGDRDLDGVTDSRDECPDTPGVPANDGCPVLDPPAPPPPGPDTDRVPADEDRCDQRDGPAWNEGCPVSVPQPLARRPQLRARLGRLLVGDAARRARRRTPAFTGGAQVAPVSSAAMRGASPASRTADH